MISTSEFKKGVVLKLNNGYWEIADFQFVNPGKGSAFTRTKLRNLKDGRTMEQTYKSGEEFNEAEYEKRTGTYIYSDRKSSVFLNEKNERISLPLEITQDKLGFMKEKMQVDLIYVEGECLKIELPKKVDMKVTESPPNLRGNTAGAVTKTVKIETGLTITVPAFIEEGDVIRINTETGEYSERI